MKNYTDSDYALNKYSKGIVYRFADGIVEVSLEDYLKENPGRTEADFHELKELSDSIYIEQDRSGYRQTRKNVPLTDITEAEECSPSSAADNFIEQQAEAESHSQKVAFAKKALNALTEVQRRRYLLYHGKQLTMRQIAEIEGVNHSKIQDSLKAAEKKIKKVLEED